MDRDCKNCVFHSPTEYTSLMCGYPVPAWLKIYAGAGGFVSGYEAKTCATYKDKAELVNESKLGVKK